MKDFSEFLNSSISDELLAAYIDGKTTIEENELIGKTIKEDSVLSETYEIVNDCSAFGSSFDWDLHKGDFGFWELGLEPAVTEEESLELKDDFKDITDNDIINEDMANSLNSEYLVIGEPGENIKDPIFIQQPDDHSCALRSQQIVLRDFGIDIPFKDLENIALANGVYTSEGTYTCDIGKVLEIAGVGMHQVDGSSLEDLMNELSLGHRVIVSVDAHELWYNDSLSGKLKNWLDDVFGHQGGNHALIVAGVEVNPNNLQDIKVVLTDPGEGGLRIEYPVKQFMDAWKDSNCFMAATDNPAPYQYDVSSGKEIPSNFVVEQHFNKFISDHSYQLNPDKIAEIPEYTPAFTGHLSMVGDMDYEVFHKSYQDLLDARIPQIKETVISDATLNQVNTGSVDSVKSFDDSKISSEIDNEENIAIQNSTTKYDDIDVPEDIADESTEDTSDNNEKNSDLNNSHIQNEEFDQLDNIDDI